MKVVRTVVPPPSPDRRDALFRNACAFWNAFCAVANSVGRTGDTSLIGPLWVNLSFSAELYFKYLLTKTSGQVVKVHDLHKLFNLLAQPTRDALAQEYESLVAGSEFYRIISSAWKTQDVTLGSVLAKAAKTFEVWRYPGEGVELNAPGSLQHVVKALQNHIQKNHPEAFKLLQGPLEESYLNIYGGIND